MEKPTHNLLKLLLCVDDKDRVDNSLLQIWKLTLSTLIKILKILKLKFRRDFEAEVWSVFAADIWLRLRS